MTLNYQWTRNSDASTRSALMPTTAERNVDFSNRPLILDPQTGAPFPNNAVPDSRISPQAKSLLNLYPLPNFADERYNYQIPIIGATHQDSLQLRGNQRLSRKNQLSGNLSYQSTRIDNPNIFNFLDVTDSTGVNSEPELATHISTASLCCLWHAVQPTLVTHHCLTLRIARMSRAKPVSPAITRTL